MKVSVRISVIVGLLLASPAAIAADPQGLLTLVVGLPLLLALSIVLALLLILRPGTIRRRVACIIFVPTLLYSLYVAIDAVTLFQDFGSENSTIGLAFFALMAVGCALFWVAIRSHRPSTDAL